NTGQYRTEFSRIEENKNFVLYCRRIVMFDPQNARTPTEHSASGGTMTTTATKPAQLASAIRLVLMTTSLLGSAGLAWAGDVAGQDTDGTTGRPLPDATVRIDALGRTATASRSGEYRFADLPAGSY